MFGRTGAADSDGRDDYGIRHRATGKSGYSPCDPSGTSVLRVAHIIAHLLGWTIRVEADLVDQLFNSSEKRLARLLLLLANFGKEDKPEPIIAAPWLPISKPSSSSF